MTVAASYTSTQTAHVRAPGTAASSSHTPPCDVAMQSVVPHGKAPAGHVPEVPVQLSATSHWPAEARHVTVAASYTSTQSLLVPVGWSAGSSSHTPPSDVPMQCVVAEWKASAGHGPEDPVQLSATSHWPAEARHVTVAASYTSTQTLLVPVQWSAGSSSHTPPSDVPIQCVVADWKASADRKSVVQVQLSATS